MSVNEPTKIIDPVIVQLREEIKDANKEIDLYKEKCYKALDLINLKLARLLNESDYHIADTDLKEIAKILNIED